MGTENMILE